MRIEKQKPWLQIYASLQKPFLCSFFFNFQSPLTTKKYVNYLRTFFLTATYLYTLKNIIYKNGIEKKSIAHEIKIFI